jgi:A/G-specific adenine glycosylase
MSRKAPRAEHVRGELLRWYDANRRDLPWRRTSDPYAIWISETMLQQTRVETVIPYYERFLSDFPDVASLASADEEEVLERWAGLGYYSRARNLHKAARAVASDFGGELPGDVDALRQLPGVGRYTAGALASIAFDKPEAIVDGNVARVLSRLHGIRKPSADKDASTQLWREAGELARGERPGDLNQALMELGATVCTPRSPVCMLCPLNRMCDAHAAGDAEAVPPKAQKKAPLRVAAAAAQIVRRGRVLMVRRKSEGLLGGLWELPGGLLGPGAEPRGVLRQAIAVHTGLDAAQLEAAGEVEHIFTHRRMRLHVFRCNEVRGRVRLDGYEESRWLRASEVDELAQATLTRKARAALGEETKPEPKRRKATVVSSQPHA